MIRYPSKMYASNTQESALLEAMSCEAFLRMGNNFSGLFSSHPPMTESEIEELVRLRYAQALEQRCGCGGELLATLKDGYELSRWDKCQECRDAEEKARVEEYDKIAHARKSEPTRRAIARIEAEQGMKDKASRQFFTALAMAGAVGKASKQARQ